MAADSGTRLYYSPAMAIDDQSEEDKIYFDLIRSIYRDDEVAFTAIIDQVKDVNINESTKNGWRPIMHAVHKNRLNIVPKLVERGAKLDVIDAKNGRSLLHNAVEQGYTSMVQLLLSYDADINATDFDGESIIWTCCRKGYDDIATLLLDDRLNNPICDINFHKKSNGQTPLFVACDRGFIKIVALLLGYKGMKCDINATDSHNRTPLMRACTKSHGEIVKLLLKHGADINILSEYGQSCLLSAFRINKSKICKILLNDDNAKDIELWRHDGRDKYVLDYKSAKSDKKIVQQIQTLLHTMLQSALEEFNRDLPESVITVICCMTY